MLFIAVTAVAIVSCSVTILYCTRALCVLVHARVKLINLNWAECSKSCPAGKFSSLLSTLQFLIRQKPESSVHKVVCKASMP